MNEPASAKGPPAPSLFLCLSGGGIRAALFHLGCLKRLHERGLLGRVYAVASTSGGAITAAMLACHDSSFDAERRSYTWKWDDFENALLEMATRGLIAPVLVLVAAWSFYALAGVAWVFHLLSPLVPAAAALGLVVSGLSLHLGLAVSLIREGAHRHYDWERNRPDDRIAEAPALSARSVGRLVRMLLRPSSLRLELMNVRLFGGRLLRDLIGPAVFFNAVDLNDGRQKVFSRATIATLDAVGCGELWRSRNDDDRNAVPLAAAVAASSAIPTFFRPVAVRGLKGRLLGVFVDGGVADNLAVNVPKAFAVHIHPDRSSTFDPARGGYVPFYERTSLVLVSDGSMPLPIKRKRSWTRLFSLKRVSDAMMNQQVGDAALTKLALERLAGVPVAMFSPQLGMPLRVADQVPALEGLLAQVRTHLDGFSLQECAALVFCGYSWIDEGLGPELTAHQSLPEPPPPRRFTDILPASFGPWDAGPAAIERAMRYASRRLLPLRWLGKKLGI
jgi:predicted acylesterase/phospholipase RssA